MSKLIHICGSGSQASSYSRDIVQHIKKLNSTAEVVYLMLFGVESGIKHIKSTTLFDRVESIFTIDDTFKTFSNVSRYYSGNHDLIDKNVGLELCSKHGTILEPNIPLGYKDGQLMLSLFHNTPDNTLPIFWSDEVNWRPLFKRYNKKYNE